MKIPYFENSITVTIFSIQWKNRRASAREAYNPTTIEHVANMITHGIWVVPSAIGVLELLNRSTTKAQLFCALVYGATLIMIFGVSTTFHCVFYCNHNRFVYTYFYLRIAIVYYIFNISF